MSRRTKAQRKRDRQVRINLGWEKPGDELQVQTTGREIKEKHETPREVTQTAMAYRQRQYGLTADQARDQRAATFIGRAVLKGEITPDQYDAANWFHEATLQYRNAMQSPGRMRGPSGFADVESHDYAAYCKEAIETYDAIVKALRNRDIYTRRTNSLGLLQAAVISDVDKTSELPEVRACLTILNRLRHGPKHQGVENIGRF